MIQNKSFFLVVCIDIYINYQSLQVQSTEWILQYRKIYTVFLLFSSFIGILYFQNP